MAMEESRYLDPFVMSLNHGETFGVFDRQGDIVDIGKTPQGIFFEGSRHLSLMDFELHGTKPMLLSSTIREDNDSLTVDLANREFEAGNKRVPESTIHVKKTKNVRNEVFYEELYFKNFNPFRVEFVCSIRFGADFRDLFELRGFGCDVKRNQTEYALEEGELFFSYLGRDDIQRITRIACFDEKAHFEKDELRFSVELDPFEVRDTCFRIAFSKKVPRDKIQIYEEDLQRAHLSIPTLKKRLPTIETSNAHLNHWIKRSGLDLLALMSCYGEELYPMAGVPWYNTPFGRDGLITAFQTLFVAPFLAKNVLLFLARHQALEDDPMADAEPGKILHELRRGELANIGALPFRKYYGSVDSTFLFIWLVGLYYFRTGDRETLERLWPALDKALLWADEYGDLDGDGFYEYKKRNPAGLDNQCWKDSWDSISHFDGTYAKAPLALCEVQGYAYRAFVMAKRLYEQRGNLEKALRYLKKANAIKAKFNQEFWVEEMDFLALALDHKKLACEVFSSNAGHCLATGIVDYEKGKILGDRLFAPDLFSGWGIRTLGANEKRFNPMSYHNGSVWPHDNSFIAYGLKRYGQVSNFNRLFKAMYETTLNMELMRLPELFCGFDRVANESPTLYPVSCSPQAWASGVVFLLLGSMLGLKIKPLSRIVSFDQPSLPDFLDWVEVRELPLGSSGEIFFTVRRVSEEESTVEIFERPEGWKVSINK